MILIVMAAADLAFCWKVGGFLTHFVCVLASMIVVFTIDARPRFLTFLPDIIRPVALNLAKDPTKSIFFINMIPMMLTLHIIPYYKEHISSIQEAQHQLSEMTGVLSEGETAKKD